MSNGRHFNPPTPAYRPRDPFSNSTPRLAEFVPSCETTKPPPSRPRPVRMDTNSPISVPVPGAIKADLPPQVAPVAPVVTPRPVPAGAPRPVAQEAHHVPPASRPKAAPIREAPVQEAKEIKGLARESRDEGKKARPAAREVPPPPAKAAKAAVAKAPAPKAAPVKEAPAPKAKAPAAKAPGKAGKGGEAELVAGDGEEIRVCEWDKCGKKFVVRSTGRTVVRRFCSGTCRGRASEARHGKR